MRRGVLEKAWEGKPEPSDEAIPGWAKAGRMAWNRALLGLLVLAPAGAAAQDLANLVYLGTDRAGTTSVFLSKVSFGFDLMLLGGPSNTEVDRFSFADGRGLHLSTSPIVAPGEAGRHTLFENAQGAPYALDSTLQTGGINPPTSGGAGGGTGGGGGSGGGTGVGGGAGGGAGEIEQALLGFGQSPVFLSPYSISDRLVGVSLGDDAALTGGEASPSPAWVEGRGFSAGDDFAGRDGDGQRLELQFGLDLISHPDLRAGLAGGIESASYDAFGGAVSGSYDGSFIGPYLAWMPRSDLVLDAWVGYAARDFDATLLGNSTDFDVDRWFVSANATAEMPVGEFAFRPKLGVFYSRDRASPHDYDIDGRTLSVSGSVDEVLLTSLSAELRRAVPDAGTGAIPYVLAGMDYYVDRPNDGQVFDGNLQLQDSSDWLGKIELGVTLPLGDGGLLDASLAYGGNDETDILAAQVRAELAF